MLCYMLIIFSTCYKYFTDKYTCFWILLKSMGIVITLLLLDHTIFSRAGLLDSGCFHVLSAAVKS